jgi:DnaJ-class molecular chaperone
MEDNPAPKGPGATSTNPGDEVPPGTPGSGDDVCPVCDGSGEANGRECMNCGGTGLITRGIGGG